MLNDSQKQLIELTKKTEDLKKQLKEYNQAIENILIELGEGSSFQDPEDGTVFEIVIPSGAFVSFKKMDYLRTKREGESRGSLSKTRAKELGYEI